MGLHCPLAAHLHLPWLLTTANHTSKHLQPSFFLSLLIFLTFFLRCGSFFISSLLVSTAAVSFLLQDVADEDTQQAHHAEDGNQGEHGVLCGLLLGASRHRAVDRPYRGAGWTFTHRAHRSGTQNWKGTKRYRKECMSIASLYMKIKIRCCRIPLTFHARPLGGEFLCSSGVKPAKGKKRGGKQG